MRVSACAVARLRGLTFDVRWVDVGRSARAHTRDGKPAAAYKLGLGWVQLFGVVWAGVEAWEGEKWARSVKLSTDSASCSGRSQSRPRFGGSNRNQNL